ncbi:hypothetical protein O181_048169 [Austropuccinia psidii MF-1]|uniref:Uncharacterized protein n=1 Tax=Austropuccinia psidii MF-1 TaxID=1389203 RepID=A0A9Q3DSG3_9BASI|nr:hypothetical protein [Austropuccinia psidii MF-1]
MHYNPEDGPEASYGPNQLPKTFPEILRKLIFYGPGPSQWAQVMWMSKWSHETPGFPACESIWALGGSSSPHRPRTVGHAKDRKDPKRPKGPEGPLITIPSKMARAQNPEEGPKWPKLQGQWGQDL